MIDTHCHLDVPRFDGDRAEVLTRAWAAGVERIVIPAIGPDAWEALLAWPGTDARVQVALGIHPQLLPDLPPEDDERHLATLDALLGRGVACAVGECGVDGPSAERAPMERQLAVLEAHFALAKKHGLPVLVHCLRAHPPLEKLLARIGPPPRGVLLHSYSGSHELVKKYVKLGCSFSFTGPITFAEARRPLDAVRAVPLERLMIESDAPDQAPVPHRGERNEPAYLGRIVDAVAAALGRPRDDVAAALVANTNRFFGWG